MEQKTSVCLFRYAVLFVSYYINSQINENQLFFSRVVKFLRFLFRLLLNNKNNNQQNQALELKRREFLPVCVFRDFVLNF